MDYHIVFNGKTEKFLNEDILERLSADYTNNTYGRWTEAFSINNGGQDIYITSTESGKTIVILFTNSTIEEILETLKGIDISDFV